MALTAEQKLELVWEAHNAKTNTSTGKQYYEETVARAYEVNTSDVFGEVIPTIPPATTEGVVKKYYPVADGGDGMLTLTVDRSVGGNVTWVALPAHNDNWSSGSADTSEVLQRFISPKSGKQYLVKVFDGNDNEIPQLDSADWFFDYSAGVLTFNGVSSRPETGNTPADSIKLKVYQYTGKTAAEVIAESGGAGLGGRERLRASLVGTKDGINTDFALPAALDVSAHYEVQYNGVGIEPSTDFSVDGSDPRLLHLIDAPDNFDTLDVIYYPVSN